MSFYHGGQRYKARAPASAQPPQFQPSTDGVEVHPLRQHSISQDNSPTIPTKQPMVSNPTSYAARVQGKPPLSLDTSPSQRTPVSYTSQNDAGFVHDSRPDPSPATARHQGRKSSVTDRSPLQKLEVKLGDISKEEKRARVEEAERNLKARRESEMTHSNSIPRKPVGTWNGNESNAPSYGERRNGSRYSDRDVSGSRSHRRTSLGLDPFPSRDRQYGYDALRTGGAALAAIDAYQAARQPYHGYHEQPHGNFDNSQSAQDHLQRSVTMPQSQTQPAIQGPRMQTTKRQQQSTGNRDPTAVPKAQRVLGTERAGAQAGASVANHVQETDPVSREQVRRSEPGPNYTVPPQTAAGREAREAVGIDSEEAVPEEYGGRGGRLKFSQIIHPFSDGTGRRYKDVEYLQDWKNAATATLTALEIDGDELSDQQPWWERERASDRSSRGRSSGTAFAAGANEDGTGRTAFNPPLSLRCGPLLRYTGMRGDKTVDSRSGQRFWRGSVMIVTEDATSSTEAPPTLRLFSQPAVLYQPPPQAIPNGTEDDPKAIEDPIAGQSKCGPRGQTLYVKHASQLTPEADLSLVEGEKGLFTAQADPTLLRSRPSNVDGEQLGRFKEVKGHRLHHERGLTFWRFTIEVELVSHQSCVAYRINGGPATPFWVPGKNQAMNIMFHSCNGFSLSVDSNKFSGPDPLWRDVLNTHQQQPFHVMIGGGDQIYNDAAMRDTHHFQEWLSVKNPEHKYGAPFSETLQDELETFYLHRYAMWFSQGLFGMANAQIPMVNIWDDHDIIDGYGSYPHHFMSCPVFTGLGAVAFKYYMLFQHQSLPPEDHQTEPSWVLGPSRGPYINQHSRSVYMSLGHDVGFIGIDCRTERMRDEVLSYETYELILDRLEQEVQKGEVKHLIVLLGIPIAYPRMTFAENILTSRAMDPIKALARTGIMGGVLNKFDGGIEVLDDLDDHWTAKHHKTERNMLIEDLQGFAAERSVRITILGGDVHLAAVGQFYSKKKYAIPKDHDPRYIPNIISSAIVNTPPPDGMADFLNKRNKVHHLDHMTDEDMIPLFTDDVDGRARNNQHLLPRRNYCIIRPYVGEEATNSPPPSVFDFDEPPPKRRRSFSLTRRNSSDSQLSGRKPSLLRRLSNRVAPPSSYKDPVDGAHTSQNPYYSSDADPHVDGSPSNPSSQPSSVPGSSTAVASQQSKPPSQLSRSDSFMLRPTIGANPKAWAKDPSGRQGHINLTSGLEVIFQCEINQKDPAGKTRPYRLLIPALDYQKEAAYHQPRRRRAAMTGFLGSVRRRKSQHEPADGVPYESNEPATPALAGDQRFTTMMEDREKTAALGSAQTHQTDRAAAAQALNSTAPKQTPANPPQELRERATLDSLPRSGAIETDWPAEVPRQPYHEQRRGSLDQHRAHVPVGRSRSLSDRSNSFKRAQGEQSPETAEDRAYRGAQQVRGELPFSQAQLDGQQERGLRRYYASPFGSSNRHDQNSDRSPPLPTKGLAPPLGAVNNRVDLMQSGAPHSSISGTRGQQAIANDGRRVVSDPVQAHKPASASTGVTASNPVHESYRSAGKDPYAHYLPEAVEAEFQSDEDISDLDGEGLGQSGRGGPLGTDGMSEISSLGDRRRVSKSKAQRESFASAQTNTSVAPNRALNDSPLYSDEEDLYNLTNSQMTPEQSPKPRSNRNSGSRPLSKVERLTGASNPSQRASYASGEVMYEDGDIPAAKPAGQASSSKAAKMLGADPDDEVNGFSDAGAGRTQNGAPAGRFGGLMRKLSERGEKTRKKLSVNGGVR